MTDFYDGLETRDPDVREAALMAALPMQVRAAQGTAALGERLAGHDASAVTSRAALAALPVTRKHELLERQVAQRATDPFGGFSAIGWGLRRGAKRVFQSPGPIYEPEGHAADYWRIARAMFAAGFRAGHLVHNSFSYHLTPAGSMMETRRARPRMHRVPGWRGQYRTAVAGDERAACRRLCRHAELPAHRDRESGRDRRRATRVEACARQRRSLPAEPARLVARTRCRGLSGLRDGRRGVGGLRDRSARRPRARRGRGRRDCAARHRRPGARRRRSANSSSRC